MISAFGIDHGIAKSYIPGAGWGKAAEMSQAGRKMLRAHLATSRAATRRFGTNEQYAAKNTPKKRKIYEGEKTPLNSLKSYPKARLDRKAMENPEMAGYSRPNGRGGGYVKVYHDAPDPGHTLRHEMAHIGPKRNPYTLQQRTQKPRRLGREEGRADYVASGKVTPGRYANQTGDEREFQRGYNEVQRKMHAARKRKTV